MKPETRFRLLQASMVILAFIMSVFGVFVVVFLLGTATEIPEENIIIWNILTVFGIATWIVGIPLFIIALIKYRKSDLTEPTGFTKLYFRRRDPKQCTICQRHPVSKKYHLKSEHKLKDFNLDDYFRDCGCDKCAIYNKSSIEG